jgi:hypothetical protein
MSGAIAPVDRSLTTQAKRIYTASHPLLFQATSNAVRVGIGTQQFHPHEQVEE